MSAPTHTSPPPAHAATNPPVHPPVDLPAEVLDQIAELIVFAPGPTGRAAVVAAVTAELAALVAWSQERCPHPAELTGECAGELTGLGRPVATAEAHLDQMRSAARPAHQTQ